MKIVYLVDFPIDGNSGKNKATREKARALANVVGEENLHFISNKKPVSLIGKVLNRLIFDISVFFKLVFKKGDYIVIQRVLFMPLTRLLFWVKGVKVVNEFHADFREEIKLLNKSALEKKLLYLASYFYNLNYYLCNGIIFNHPYLKEKFDSVFRKPSIYSYNGSDVHSFYPFPQAEARQALNLPGDETIFLFLGSVSQWHGVDYLIDLFNQQEIIQKTNFKLYIVGAKRNSYVESLENKAINPNILFIPPVEAREACLYINSSDYCLLPVKSNRTSPGSPIKLYDYIACGKPVITQEGLAGYADEVVRYNLGYLIDFPNAKSSASRLLSIVENSGFDYVTNNRKIAETKASWAQRMANWVEFFKRIQK